jgi:hypothetical protein
MQRATLSTTRRQFPRPCTNWHLPIAAHVAFALVFVRGAKPEPLIKAASRICVDHRQSNRPTNAASLLDQPRNQLRANVPRGRKDAFTNTCHLLQSSATNRYLSHRRDDSNLRHGPALADTSDLSIHVEVGSLMTFFIPSKFPRNRDALNNRSLRGVPV